MSAEVQSPTAPPEIKSIDRVTSIPIVQDSISVIHNTLTTYTPTVYAYGQAIGSSAYSLSAPLQVRLAPLIVGADGYALKGLDVAQERFPTPFTIKSEEVFEGIKSTRDSAVNAVTRPVYGLAAGVDSSLTPIVDRLEVAIHKLGHENPEASTSTSESTQVGRLYHLSLDLRTQIYNLSSEQIKQLQTQNVYIQKATEKVTELNQSLTTTYVSAKDKSFDLVNETRSQAQVYTASILSELEKIQATTLSLPGQLQAKLQPLQEGIKSSLNELTTIVKSDLPVGEKVQKVGTSVQEKVQPLLAQTTETIQAYIAEAKLYVAGGKAKAEEKTTIIVEQANGTVAEATS